MDIKLPRLGEGAESGTVVTIFVKEGDEVKEGQTIIELENEKAVAPIPADAAGKVTKIYLKEGDKVTVGQRILALDGAGVAPAAPKPETPARKAEPAPRPEADRPSVELRPAAGVVAPRAEADVAAAPSIRKLARELGIDLTRVRGSASGGRIVIEDVKAYIADLQAIAFEERRAPGRAPVRAVAESIDFSKWGAVTKKPVSSLRRIIAQRMHESWAAVPRVTQFDEADVTTLMDLRKKYAGKYEEKGGHLTLTPFLLKAAAAVLKAHPIFNSSLDEAAEEVVTKQYYHIGVAVDTDQGLIVPVIRDVDQKSLLELSQELQQLAEKTRQRKISPDELKGGTFTISNQGGIGSGHFTPIVNQPEVAILGVGRGAAKPVYKNDKLEKRTMLPLTLSYDHRVIDGGSAARFMVDLVKALETFDEAEVKI